MWAVRDWLWVARRFGFPHLTIETDSVFVYNALCRKQVQAAQLKRMLHAVLVSKFSSVQVTFYYQEANGVADLLTKNATTSHGSFVLRSAAPDFLLSALFMDQRGTVVPHFFKFLVFKKIITLGTPFDLM